MSYTFTAQQEADINAAKAAIAVEEANLATYQTEYQEILDDIRYLSLMHEKYKNKPMPDVPSEEKDAEDAERVDFVSTFLKYANATDILDYMQDLESDRARYVFDTFFVPIRNAKRQQINNAQQAIISNKTIIDDIVRLVIYG